MVGVKEEKPQPEFMEKNSPPALDAVEAENERLNVLHNYHILDTGPDPSFDRVTDLAAKLLGAPIACINLVDEFRIWSKAKYGTETVEYLRKPGLCSSAIQQDEAYVVSDAAIDPRTKNHPLVKKSDGVRFYAGAPLKVKTGHTLGTLCVIDFQPREITPLQLSYLEALAKVATDELELHVAAIANKVLHEDLALSEHHFRSVFEQAGIGVSIADPQTGAFIRVNQKYCDILGYSQEELLQMDFLTLTHPDDLELQKRVSRALFDGEILHYEIEKRYIRKDKTIVWVNKSVRALWQTGKEKTAYIALVHDITQKKLAEFALKESEQRWKFALEGSNQGVWDLDIATNQIYLTPRCKEMLGYEIDQISSDMDNWVKLIHPDDLPCLISARESAVTGTAPFFENEHRKLAKDGTWRWIQVKGMVVSRNATGIPQRLIGTYTDIHEKKCAQAEALRLAHFDGLTNLPNRTLFVDRLESEIKKAKRDATSIALLMIDLDRFSEINDTLGHQQGDRLIQQSAERLVKCVREVDTIGRLGGDEFIIIMPGLTSLEGIETILTRVLTTLATPYELNEDIVYSSASIGITVYPDDAEDVEGLLRNADQAMYAAKDSGRNCYAFFTEAMQESARNKLQLSNDLRHAVSRGQIEVYFQPIVDLSSFEIHKAEALVRWKHPVKGWISPAVFIPIAEETGLITEIGNWVFHQAIDAAKLLRSEVNPDFQISINKSPIQFRNDDGAHTNWMACLQQQGLTDNCLVLEITEGLLLHKTPKLTEQFQNFKKNGVQIALDDFGTGYSSLSYLKHFDIDYIKIDQSFVRNLGPDSSDLALCEAMIAMSHKLGIRVIAEGVETMQQLQLLKSAECDFVQGYLFSKPIPLSDFLNFVQIHYQAA